MEPSIISTLLGAGFATIPALILNRLDNKDARRQRDREAVADFLKYTREAGETWAQEDTTRSSKIDLKAPLHNSLQSAPDTVTKMIEARLYFYNALLRELEILDLRVYNRTIRRKMEQLEQTVEKQKNDFLYEYDLVFKRKDNDILSDATERFLPSPISDEYKHLRRRLKDISRRELQ